MLLTLNNGINRKNNNFDLIRLLAATAVVFGHSFALFLTNGHQEPLQRFLGDDYSGSLAVYIFFFLSGIFITSSFIGSNTLGRYLLIRIFRIWPGLIVCIMISVFIIGPFFAAANWQDYFSDAQTYKYLLKNCLMIKYEPRLTAVFTGDHYNKAVNGSLWTLPVEIRCYLIVFILGVAGYLNVKAQ